MGNRKRTGQDGTKTTERSANKASAASPEPPAPPPGQHGNGSSPSPYCNQAGLDAYIRHLADAAPPLTDAQRDTLTLLLRRPRRR